MSEKKDKKDPEDKKDKKKKKWRKPKLTTHGVLSIVEGD